MDMEIYLDEIIIIILRQIYKILKRLIFFKSQEDKIKIRLSLYLKSN